MKKIISFILLCLTFSVYAQMNEVECETRGSNSKEDLIVEIERPFMQTPWRRATVYYTKNGEDVSTFIRDLSINFVNGFNRIRYWGAGAELSIDLWPDNRPLWGRAYAASFRDSQVFGGKFFNNLYCRFPWAN